jgi:hypothetical protein
LSVSLLHYKKSFKIKQMRQSSRLESNKYLGARQYALETELNASTKNVSVADTGPVEAKAADERAKIIDLVKKQANDVEALKAEIHILRRKGGHVYSPVARVPAHAPPAPPPAPPKVTTSLRPSAAGTLSGLAPTATAMAMNVAAGAAGAGSRRGSRSGGPILPDGTGVAPPTLPGAVTPTPAPAPGGISRPPSTQPALVGQVGQVGGSRPPSRPLSARAPTVASSTAAAEGVVGELPPPTDAPADGQ